MPTWIDDEGRLREQADDRHQFLRPIPFECLDPWTSYDSWDAELAIRLITIGYNLDIKAYWDEAKDFPHGSTGWDAARAYIDVYQRGMSIAKSSIAAGLLRNPDTPANWLAWAERKGYSVTHLKSQAAAPAPVPVVADSASNAPTLEPKTKPRTWWDVSSAYIVEVMQAGQYATAKELYRALEAKAGPNAPFDKGTGANRGSLFVREIAQPLSVKTVQNNWPALRELAKK